MTTAPCAMAPMVEARRDGRLDAREASSIERHVAGCASCRALEAELGRLAELSRRPLVPDASPLQHQRGRVALLRAAASTGHEETATPARASARWPPRRLVQGGVLAAAAVVLLGSAGHELGARAMPGAHAPAALLALKLPRPPALATGAASGEATVTVVGTGSATAGGAAEARFQRSRFGEVERVELIEGAIELHVPRLAPDARFLVTTSDAEVEVRGTRFRVEAHQAHIAVVSVTEGKVEVRYQGTTTLLPAGAAWAPSGGAPSSAMPSGALASSSPIVVASETSPARSGGAVSASGHREGGRARAPAGTAAAGASSGAPSSSRSAFADGVRLIERGDYAAAAEKLEAFSATTPGDERAEDAAFLAVLALQRAGRLDAAAVAARRYLDRYPAGRRRAEAAVIANAASPAAAAP